MLTKLKDIILYYQVEGSGPVPVLFLHGWGRDSSYWNRFLTELKDIKPNWTQQFTFYLVDLPGFGLSTEPTSVWGAGDYAKFLYQWISAISSVPQQHWILVGHSFGGKVSLFLSHLFKPCGTILLASSGVQRKLNLGQNLARKSRLAAFKVAKALIKLWYHFNEDKIETALERYRQRHGSSDYRAAKGIMRSVLVRTINEDVTSWLKELKPISMLLIWGEKDLEVPLVAARTIKALTGARLEVLADTGHDLLQDDALNTSKLLAEFLQQRYASLGLEVKPVNVAAMATSSSSASNSVGNAGSAA